MSWHIIAGEYPPCKGGVGDYTEGIARGLMCRGELVHVWQRGDETEPVVDSAGVVLHRCAGDFCGDGLVRLGRELNRIPGHRRLLIQYVPHAFGCRGMNIQFARWVRGRAEISKDEVNVMFHEVAYPWVKWPVKHNLLAAVNRWMASTMIRGASKLYVSTTAWTDLLVRLGAPRGGITLLAIPSNVPSSLDVEGIAMARSLLIQNDVDFVVGHFGTYGTWVVQSLYPILQRLLQQHPVVHVHLVGGGSAEFRKLLVNDYPCWATRVTATGRVSSMDVAKHILACDAMVQPFPDGANTRRSSLMACLINGVAVVSNIGKNTESIWHETGAVALVPSIAPEPFHEMIGALIGDRGRRAELARRGREAYDVYFSLDTTIQQLTSGPRVMSFGQ